MGIILNSVVIAHVPRTGGIWRESLVKSLGNWQVYPHHSAPPPGLPVVVFKRDPVEWLLSFVNWSYDNPDLQTPWLSAAMGRYGPDLNRVCECLLAKPGWWKDQVLRRTEAYLETCGRFGFTRTHVLGYLDEIVGPQSWLRRCVAGPDASVLDMSDMANVMERLLAPVVGTSAVRSAMGLLGRVNSGSYRLGKSLAPELAHEVRSLDA